MTRRKDDADGIFSTRALCLVRGVLLLETFALCPGGKETPGHDRLTAGEPVPC